MSKFIKNKRRLSRSRVKLWECSAMRGDKTIYGDYRSVPHWPGADSTPPRPQPGENIWELLRKYLVHQARVLANKERQGIPSIYPLDFSFFKPFQHSLWTEKYEQNLDISKVSMLKPGLLLFYVSKDKWSVSLWCFCSPVSWQNQGLSPGDQERW